MARKQKVIDQLVEGPRGPAKGRKVTVLTGTARSRRPHGARSTGGDSGDVELTADAVILASGSVPRTIPGFDVDGTHRRDLRRGAVDRGLPAPAVVIGGGAIGCEFASMMSDLGTKVTILEALPKILPGLRQGRHQGGRCGRSRSGASTCAPASRSRATSRRRRRHARVVRSRATIRRGRPGRGVGRPAPARRRPRPRRHRGRRSTTAASWRSTSAAAPARTASGRSATCIATPQLAHVGFAEGIVAIKDILGEDPVPVDYGKVPWCIYCHPEVAFAGYSEEAAKEPASTWSSLRSTATRQRPGADRRRDRGHGEGHRREGGRRHAAGASSACTWSGPWVTEQLGQGYLAVNWEATVDEVAALHPAAPDAQRAVRRGGDGAHRTPLHGCHRHGGRADG